MEAQKATLIRDGPQTPHSVTSDISLVRLVHAMAFLEQASTLPALLAVPRLKVPEACRRINRAEVSCAQRRTLDAANIGKPRLGRDEHSIESCSAGRLTQPTNGGFCPFLATCHQALFS